MTAATPALDHEAIVIGAGMCGVYMLHKLREQGIDAIALEAGDGPGGTWYWNRYPGARFDSESYSYGFSFSQDLLDKWNWSEHFAAQPETRRYVNFVIDELKLRHHLRCGTRIQALDYDDASDTWTLTADNGDTLRSRFVFSAIGMLSATTMPRIEGVNDYAGPSFHTYHWPDDIDLTGKRVAVIGTGATGVQVIGAIAPQVGHLSVYQRRPNWCAPLRNAPLGGEELRAIKARYDEIFAQCAATPGGFLHGPDRRDFNSLSRAQREAFWEELYQARGFAKWLGNFRDVFMSREANAEYSAFMADKIRARIDDPKVAEKLIPQDHAFGARRVPMETNYYEAYNQDNVDLIDINDTPIKRVTKTGIETSDGERTFDVIVFATGFDAITGSYDRMQITGRNGQTLRSKWLDGPSTYLGVSTRNFPNLFILAGPQSSSVSANFPRGIETAVEWASDLMAYLRQHKIRRIEPTQQAEDDWVEHVASFYHDSMIGETRSWFTGYNSNVDGHGMQDHTRHLIYFGGAPQYRERISQIAANGYEGFELSSK
ncbi:MAG: NAD(P)/FAD-dependent oxidoreductase [Pseudomonadota bacterium]